MDVLEQLAASLARTFHTPCTIRPEVLDLGFAYEERRGQHYSTAILQRMEELSTNGARLLAVTSSDLYVPVLTFVFGEAQLEGNCAIVSTARLHLFVRGQGLHDRREHALLDFKQVHDAAAISATN